MRAPLPRRVRRSQQHSRRLLIVGGVLVSVLLVSACVPPKIPAPSGPPKPTLPKPTVTTTPPTTTTTIGDCTPAPASAGAATGEPVAQMETLSAVGAADDAHDEVAAAQAEGASAVPLAIAEREGDGSLSITTHQVVSAEEGAQLAREAAKDGDVLAVEAAARVSITAKATDPSRNLQWGLDATTFEQVWPRTTGTGVTVAIIDSGVQASHPDLAGQVLAGQQILSPAPPVAGGTIDGHGHGTHVAGIVAAVASNGIGGTGAAPGVKILPVRVLDSTGTGWDSDVAAGITWAVDHGAKVINLSLAGPTASLTEQIAVQYALDHEVVVVAAAGNDGQVGNPVSYPAAFPGVIAVGALQLGNTHASYSTSGNYLSLSAPGSGIWSTWTGSSYRLSSGTSMSSPFVAGAVAMVAASYPAWSAAQIRNRLATTATNLGPAGWDPVYGSGLVNVRAAVGC